MNVVVHQAKKTILSKTILDVFDVILPDHAIIMVIGPNGAGKSTFLRTISGIDKESLRDIEIDHKKIIQSDILNHMVQQTYLFDLSVEENLRLGGKGVEKLDEKVEELLTKLDLLTLRNETVSYTHLTLPTN
jgi:ABC-type multidrug transport system ATPase subunit